MSSLQFPHVVDPSAHETYEDFRAAHISFAATPGETLARWAHYHILVAISEARSLRQLLVFKGGNALRSAYGSVRATKDLDFSIADTLPQQDVETWLERALLRKSQRADIELRLQSFKAQPKNPQATRRTWKITIGYALKSHENAVRRLSTNPPQSPLVIPVEISENEALGVYETHRISGAENLNVSTIENIIAEKLRALLQQLTRDRHRPQDVFDIAYQCLRAKRGVTLPLDLLSLRKQFSEKCLRRGVSSDFKDFKIEEIWKRAERDYDDLRVTVLTNEFLSFEDARSEVEALLKALQSSAAVYYPPTA